MVVTYSIKYRDYQRKIRNSQIERVQKAINAKSLKLDKFHQYDYKRFDGFYGVCTNLESSPEEIIKVEQRRWKIEESFRIMKSDFQSGPVYLSRDDRIIIHFTTCFLSLVLHRFLEKKLEKKFTSSEIINTLRKMNFMEVIESGYIPTYTRTDLTGTLHEKFNFTTDYQIISNSQLKKFLKKLKIKKHCVLSKCPNYFV